MRTYHWLTAFLLFIFLSFTTGCGDGGGSSNADVNTNSGVESDGTGTLMLSLTDAPGDYQAVYVTIEDVMACLAPSENVDPASVEDEDCEWVSLTAEKGTYDLLKLRDGVTETLGISDLPAGVYHQMRLMIGLTPDDGTNDILTGNPRHMDLCQDYDLEQCANYIVDSEQKVHELKIPSGVQSGIKIVHSFEVVENRFQELLIDFDAEKSVVNAGKSGKYILKPTIKVSNVENLAMVSGLVESATDAEEVIPIAGAKVTAITEENDEYIEENAAITDEYGNYAIYVKSGKSYTIVASADGFESACAAEKVSAENGGDYYVDFALTEDKYIREVQIIVAVGDVPPDTDMIQITDFNITFRKELTCGANSIVINQLSRAFPADIEFSPSGYHIYNPDVPIELPSGADSSHFKDYILSAKISGYFLDMDGGAEPVPFELAAEQDFNLYGGGLPQAETINFSYELIEL